MAAKSLGQYLLDRGLITPAMLAEALEYQHQRIKPLCNVATEGGRATREELARLEKDAGGLGDAESKDAIRKRLVQLEQLESSWRTLSERGTFLAEALVRNGHLTTEVLDPLVLEYRKAVTAPTVDLSHLMPNQPETARILSHLIQIALDLFTHYTGRAPEILAIRQSLIQPEAGSLVFRQHIMGDIGFHYSLLLPPRLMLSLAASILQEPVSEMDETALDALTEFINVAVGNTCAKFSMRDYHVSAGAPEVLDAEAFAATLKSRPIVVQARLPEGDFQLACVF